MFKQLFHKNASHATICPFRTGGPLKDTYSLAEKQSFSRSRKALPIPEDPGAKLQELLREREARLHGGGKGAAGARRAQAGS